MNKEGIFSFFGEETSRTALWTVPRDPANITFFLSLSYIGYLAIFLVGVDVGLYVLPNDPYFFARKRSNKKKAKKGKLAMILASLGFLLCMGFMTSYGILRIPVSRQMVIYKTHGKIFSTG